MPRPFDGRIRLEPSVIKVCETKCLCSPFCQGASSRDWLSSTPGVPPAVTTPGEPPPAPPPSADPSSRRTHRGEM